MADTAIFDVDGTLVDTNYQHALAFYRAFRRYDITLPMWRLHRATGMGGDQIVAHVAGDEVERRHGSALREAWVEEFDKLIDEVRPFEGARDLMEAVKSRGFRVVLASSGKPEHVDAFLDLVDGRSVANAWTTSEDVEHTKPAPDLLQVALDKATDRPGDADVVVVGDSTWDFVAAGRFGARGVALLTGGFSREELTEAGAVEVADTLPEVGRLLHRGWR